MEAKDMLQKCFWNTPATNGYSLGVQSNITPNQLLAAHPKLQLFWSMGLLWFSFTAC